MLVTIGLAMQLAGCSPRQLIVNTLADELAQGQGSERDLDLLRDAAPFHLKLSESVLAKNPSHAALAEAVAAGYTQYAYAFVAFEADKIEARDVKAAHRLRQRAARLYARAHRHAMRALEAETPGFRDSLAHVTTHPRLRVDQAGLAYWAAASWGTWISLSKDDPEIVADLPLAIRLAGQAWALAPAWGGGALSGLMAAFEAARPGGSPHQALQYFDLAIQQGGDRNAGALVGKAEGFALPAGDRVQFESLLQQAIAVREPDGDPLSAQNEAMRLRARWLLERADDLF